MAVQDAEDRKQLGAVSAHTANISMVDEEENYPEPGSLQEELNEIVDAFYECVPEEDIRAYQRYVEDIEGQRIAEQALIEPAMAPTFDLEDQDGDQVSLKGLLQQGPVVLTFYRGKWCPHCNATLMHYQNNLLPALKQYNATLVAISPMMPDGTAFLATKRDLQFSVCSDFNNTLAKAFKITFTVQPHTRPFMTKWGDHLPEHNGVDGWDIPLPATYVIAPEGHIAWSFLDNDPGIRAEAEDIVQEVAKICNKKVPTEQQQQQPRKPLRKLFNRSLSTTFDWHVKTPKFMKKNNKAFCKTPQHDIDLETALDIATKLEPGNNTADDDSSLSGSSRHSIKSDGARLSHNWKRQTRKGPRCRSRTQSAQEFLGQYFLSSLSSSSS